MTDEKKWERALIDYSADASIGRLFKGLIHNLNGVGQAFSMQAELLTMMFDQADKTLQSIKESDSLEKVHKEAESLQEMMAKRSGLTQHLHKQVQILYDIMRRCSSVMEDCRDPGSIHAFKLREVVRTEVEYLSAENFFKHKVNKEIVLADNIPAFSWHQVTLHKILSVFLENASQAMENATFPEGEPPKLIITSSLEDSIVRLDVEDNGPGVDENIVLDVFAPFVSGSERLGLGLYLARTLADEFKGVISFESSPGKTRFSLMIPLSEVTVEG